MKIKLDKNKILQFLKKNKKIGIILILIIVIFIVFIGLFKATRKNTVGNTISNLQNGGMATLSIKGDIFYQKTGTKSGIYKTKQKNLHEMKIKNTQASYLNVYGKHFYYLEQDGEDEKFNIIKSTLNGNQREKIVKDVDHNSITVVDGWIYYFKDKILYRIKEDGKAKMTVCQNVILNYGVKGKFIYFIYNNGEKNILARKKLDGTDFLKLAENVSKDFEIIGNNIFFIEQIYNKEQYQYNYSLCRMKLNGKNRHEVLKLPNEIKNVNITKEEVYYTTQNNDNTWNIYINKYNEKEGVIIAKTKIETNICVTGKSIFYIDLNDDEQIETQRLNNIKNGG